MIIGGGNIICSGNIICKTNNQNQEVKDNPMTQHVGQTTTQQQREYFIENLENQVNTIKTSSGTLKNQNSKEAFTKSIKWMNNNQLVVFDIMIGLKASDIHVIETFEICILMMLYSIENVLQKSKNIYLGFIICNQTVVLVTAVYRYYLSHPMDEKKSSKILDLKENIKKKIEGINQFLDKLKENDISFNYLEQSLKIIMSFTFALPENQSFKPVLKFASGLGIMILTGGTSGLSEIFSGIKDGLQQVVNKKINEEQVDNFVMFVNLEKIKFSIIKILFDEQIDKKDEQIKETLISIGKTIEKSSSWSKKYYFVQILSELIQYQPHIDSASLSKILTDQKFSYDLDGDQIWELLVKNNWVSQYNVEDGSLGSRQKVGFLNFDRSNLVEIDIHSIRLKNDTQKVKTKTHSRTTMKPKIKDNPTEIIQNFVVSLNQILKQFNPISSELRHYILKGDQQFKGLLSYCYEGLEDQSSLQGKEDFFSGKDPIEIIQISLEKILNFANDFFNQQFTHITKNSESQLRVLFIASLKDYSDDITNYIFTSNFKFESILDVNLTLKNFTGLSTQLDQSLKKFVEKIQNYSSELSKSLQKIQAITDCLQEHTTIADSVKNFTVNQSHDFFVSVASDIINKLVDFESTFELLQRELNLESFEIISSKEQTIQIFNRSNTFVQQFDDILIQFHKLQLLLGDKFQNITTPNTFIKLKFLLKKIQGSEEKDPKLNKNKNLVSNIMRSNQFKLETLLIVAEIYDLVSADTIQKSPISIQPEQEIILDKVYYCMKMVNEVLKRAFSQLKTLSQNLEELQKSPTLTQALKWTQLVNEGLKKQVQKDNLTRESLKTFIVQQAYQIDNLDLQDEQESRFNNSCNLISDIYNDLSKQMQDIFMIISDSKKLLLPQFQDRMTGDLMMIMGNPLNELKSYMTCEMSHTKERLVDDIQAVFKEFGNNEFAKSIGETITSLKSISSFVDLGGLASSQFEKYADQNWRIRDRIVLILFDLNRISGGENGDQIYANTLIHMKAKDTSLKVQQTLKNEELLLEMKSILSTNWKSQETQIKTYIQNNFKDLDQQVEKMKKEKANKDLMLKIYEKSEAKLNQQLDNISDIGQIAGIQLEFAKELKKNLFKLSQDVVTIKNTLEKIDDYMTLQKGKSVYQLLYDRKSYIFAREKENELNVKLKVCEYNQGEKKNSKTYNVIDEWDESDNEHNPLYTTVLSRTEEFQKNDEDAVVENNFMRFSRMYTIDPHAGLIKEADEKDDISSILSTETVDNLNSPEESFVFNYMQNNINNSLLQEIIEKQEIKMIEKKKKKKNIIDKFLDPNHKKNSLLLRGQIGFGLQNSSKQIEYYIWRQRRVLRAKVHQMIVKSKSAHFLNVMKNHSINEIFKIMEKKKLIDKKGYFMGKFIELESKLEDIKFLDQITDQKEQSEDIIEESLGSEFASDTEESGYILKDLVNEKSAAIFKTDFIDYMELETQLCYAIYEILDGLFQNLPFPIYIQLDKINDPKKLINETLTTSQYNFTESNIRQLNQLAKSGDLNLIFIITGYEKLKQQYIGLNLFTCNDFEEYRPSNDHKYLYPKVITTANQIALSENYETNFQNIFKGNQRGKYYPEEFYVEYCIEILNEKQIFNYLKYKFIFNLKDLLYETWITQYNRDQEIEVTDKIIQDNFHELFYPEIKQTIHDQKIYKQDSISEAYQQYLIERFDQFMVRNPILSSHNSLRNSTIRNSTIRNSIIQNSQALLSPFSNEQFKQFRMKLQNIVSKKLYLMIIQELKIISLLKSQSLLQTFIDVIDQLIIHINSSRRLKQSITNILTQEETLLDNKKICINDIINLLTKPHNFLDNNFNISQKMDLTEIEVLKMLNRNAYLKSNQDLTKNLMLLIVKALYDMSISRYHYYNIFLYHSIKKMINIFKGNGQLIEKETSMLNGCFVFATRLANAFQRNGIEQLKYENHSQLYQVKSQWDEFFLDNENSVRKQVRDCLPLLCEDNKYSFIDPSVKNYILSKEYYNIVDGLQFSSQFLDYIIQFREAQKKNKLEGLEGNKKKSLQKNQIPELGLGVGSKVLQDQYTQQQLIDILRNEIQESMKQNFEQLQKQITQGDNYSQKQQENKLYLEEFLNNSKLFQDFYKFYKKFDKSMLKGHLQEKIQENVKQLKNIAELQLNQQPDLYSIKNSGVCEFLSDKLKLLVIERETNQFMQNLITTIKIAKFEKDMQVSACNAIGLLIHSHISFNNVDFSGLDLSNTNFYGGQFYRCTFKDCNMTKVNLSNSIMHKCHFINTNLSFAILGNACLLNCKFTSNTNLKKVNFMRSQDIDYNKHIDYKEKENKEVLKDPLVYAMISPFDNNFLLAFHTYQVFITYMINESSKLVIKVIKSFQQPFTRCGMIEFNYNDKPHLIAGQGNRIVLIDIKKMQIIQTIQLQKINTIISLNINQIDSGILVGGVGENSSGYIELMHIDGDSKVLVEECDQLVIDKQNGMIICHADDKDLYTSTVVCLDLSYNQIGQKKYLHKKLGYIQDNQLQKTLKLNNFQAIDHPSYDNLHLQINTDKNVTDVNLFQYDGMVTNLNGKQIPKRDNLDHIRIYQKDIKKYGRHQKIVLNKIYPKQMLILSEFGLIQRLNFFNQKSQNYELVQETHQQLNYIQFFIKVKDQDKQFLSCYIKNHFNGIIKFRKLQFDAKKQSDTINKFSIMEEYNLHTSPTMATNTGQQLVIRHEILKMQNHELLAGQFIVVVQENQNLIKVFLLNEILSESDPTDFTEFQLNDLTDTGELFSSFEIHPQDHYIFCFFYNQEDQKQCPQAVIFNVEKNQKQAVFKFEMSPLLWKIHVDSSNFNRIFLYNQFGQFKVYNVGSPIKVQVQTDENELKAVRHKSKQESIINLTDHLKLTGTELNIFQNLIQITSHVKPEHELIFYDSIDKNQCLDIIGFRPNSKNSQFLYFFDYFNQNFIQYDTYLKEKTIFQVNFKQKFINNPISGEEKQRKIKKIPKVMKNDYFENAKSQVEEFFKNHNSSLEQAMEDENYKEIIAQYKDQIQLVFHPILPIIFMVFKEQKVIVVYNIYKKSIVQLIKIPLYFDKQRPFNMTVHDGNKNMLICTYYQTIDVYVYRNNDKMQTEEFTNIYTKVFGKSIFLMDNSQFVNCIMNQDTFKVLEQNGASLSKQKYFCME